ncbi:helix-turn-helix transcriptional regulator [Streptomyces sp. ALI-76-A]|uniref:helix-turn-helix domain-containing protein n=1 Tax=Streptomyces sp. ALI-76-A TaxID=3025736 RepID=UPI00256F6654|nr:helix-turn-helix transcriptional regulator [Streptomyces sp. ALI-76-A]MDL5199745.1 helix-turn-helix transcriptional regulator [Streptomyces sp. ALI-76-A]
MGQPARRTARRRRLGAEIKEARVAAGVTPEQAARAIHGDKSKISRIETGRHRVSRLELETLMDLCRIHDPQKREWLVALSTEGHRRSWWRRHGDVLQPDFKELLTLEEDAERISAFQTQVLPGLVQTKNYATSVIRSSDPTLSDDHLEFFADFRVQRQAVLDRENPPSYLCIVTEGVLRQQVGGPEVMAEQLGYLVKSSQRPNVTIRVIPFEQPGYTGTSGSFVLYSYPDPLDLDVVQVEYLDGALYLEEDESVKKYRHSLDLLRESALPAPESIDLISKIARDLVPQRK